MVVMDEYAVTNQISGGTYFAWRVPYNLKKGNRIIFKVKKKYWRTNHKYGLRLPNHLKESVHIDQENGNTYWKGAIDKEMKKSKISYKQR